MDSPVYTFDLATIAGLFCAIALLVRIADTARLVISHKSHKCTSL